MRVLHCDHCQQLVFFENVQCLRCGHPLAYMPDIGNMVSLEAAGDGLWRSPAPDAEGKTFRLCRNYTVERTCNWTVDADDPNPLCRSCRLTRVIPDLGVAGNRERWYRLGAAKRRVLYSLLGLGLPVVGKSEDPQRGLAFEFLADLAGGAPQSRVMTGHDNGVITISLAEADDDERERRRLAMHEPYRTLLGHFRHEIGHYYWDRLIDGGPRLEDFRRVFGDDRADYGQALQRHYREGAPADWPARFISSYASSHPWEDWAETWAHYLHMTDTLETAAATGLMLRPQRPDEPALLPDPRPPDRSPADFNVMIDHWYPLTYVLNNLNRGLGLADGYPFVLADPIIEKLRFVHDTIAAVSAPLPVG